MKLFEERARISMLHKSRGQSAYEFLDDSAWKIADFMRKRLNNWASTYPMDIGFLSSFKSKSDSAHYSTSFELVVYTILKNGGFNLKVHPDTGTTRKPDFSIEKDGDKISILECTLASNSFESPKIKNQKNVVEDIIEQLDYYPYFINLDFQETSDSTFSRKSFLRFIDNLKIQSEGINNEELFHLRHLFSENGWEIEISLLRKSSSDIKRSLGFITQNAKTIDTNKPVLVALQDKKASNYGITNTPYVIAVNTNDLFGKENSYTEALFGQGDNIAIDLTRQYQDCFFLHNGNPINTSVSAVVVFRNFDIFTLESSSIAVWHNPFAKNPVSLTVLPFEQRVYHRTGGFLDKVIHHSQTDIFKLLDIDRSEYLSAKADRPLD